MKRRLLMLLPLSNAPFKSSTFRKICLVIIGAVALTLPFVLLPSGIAQRADLSKAQDKATQNASKPGYQSPGDRHKLLVSDEATASKVESQGGRLIADYSSYKIYETTTDAMNSLASDGKVEVRDEDN